jgi:hypothetical protein
MPRQETEDQFHLANQMLMPKHRSWCQYLLSRAASTLMKSKLSNACGQYFFWKPVDKRIL